MKLFIAKTSPLCHLSCLYFDYPRRGFGDFRRAGKLAGNRYDFNMDINATPMPQDVHAGQTHVPAVNARAADQPSRAARCSSRNLARLLWV
ncbi:hypothetical protein, partial [Cloacibacillus porcorum]